MKIVKIETKRDVCIATWEDASKDVFSKDVLKDTAPPVEPDVNMLEANAEFQVLYGTARASAYLAKAARTKKEMETYLKKIFVTGRAAQTVIDALLRHGFINDMRFAQMFVMLRSEEGWGRKRIFSKLLIRGVSRDDIDNALSEYSFEAEMANLYYLVESAFDKETGVLAGEQQQKILQKAVRKGFAYSDSLKAVADVIGDQEPNEKELVKILDRRIVRLIRKKLSKQVILRILAQEFASAGIDEDFLEERLLGF